MIYEFALDPKLIDNFKDARFYLKDFKGGEGRFLALVPSKWKKSVYEGLGSCSEIERKKIGELLNALVCTRKRGHNYDQDKSWLDNAIESHAAKPFRAIISHEKRASCPASFSDAGFLGIEELWGVPKSRHVRRKATEMVNAVEGLLEGAKKVMLIDPYFSAEPRHLRVLRELLGRIASLGAKGVCVMYHLRDNGAQREWVESAFRKGVNKSLNRDLSVEFFIWTEPMPKSCIHNRILHNRFILTEEAGVSFHIGLDEAGEDGVEEDVVSLLPPNVLEGEWKKYTTGQHEYSFLVGGA